MQLIQSELHYILTLTHPFFYLFHRVVPLNDNKEAVTVPITDLREGEMVKAGGETLKNACLNDDQLKVKFIITIYSYN